MATAAEIRDRAANDLGILRLNQSLQAQDSTRITDAYNEVYARLKNEGLAVWASTAEVPDHLVQHVVNLVAYNCLGTYGVSKDRYARIKAEVGPNGENSIREIRKLVVPQFTSYGDPRDY